MSIAGIPLWAPKNIENESLNEGLCILPIIGLGHRKYRLCVLAVKVPPVKYQSWPEMDSSWSRGYT